MDIDERKWVEEAVGLCETASRKNSLVLFVRRQDHNDQADIVVTNASTADIISALMKDLSYAKEEA